MSARRLHLILAPKERFEAAGAGAFALNALETSLASRWRDHITIFGTSVARPFTAVHFQPLELARWPLRGRNMAMAHAYAEAVRRELPVLAEVCNRPVMVQSLRRQFQSVPLLLHLGNDPRGMDGSRTVVERQTLLSSTNAIVCVSDFVRRCFLDGLTGDLAENLHVIHTGVACADAPDTKEKCILFVGRIIREKGVLELVRALALVLPRHPEWSASIVGAHWFGVGNHPDRFEREVAREASACSRIALSGFRPHEEVVAAQRQASIAVVPSKWDDPFPRTALEALAAGCALVCSRRGGLPEIGEERALFLDEVSVGCLEHALDRLISMDSERIALQHRGRTDFPFAVARTTRSLDNLRDRLVGRTARAVGIGT
ncbi:MAG TPA: glycosyltransferase family 4 protein [Rhizomicrobium sp.]|jgi:glycosyltransferase involved in cell wall biosynthesis